MIQFKEEIRTDRMRLKVLRHQNAEVFASLVSKNRSRLQESFPITVSRATDAASAGTYLQELELDRNTGRSVLYGLWFRETLVGMIIVKNIDWRIPRSEVGYFVSKTYEGLGFTSEALKAVCDYCLEELSILKICAKIIPTNSQSRQLVEKLGFLLEGTLRKEYKTGLGEVVDVCYYGLLNLDDKT
ncbi:GNAT family N-acetyltransferase [Pontibacter qinzhouensis]|uniref:GNAT family N-acetyltransferase n=1 Tax=Pontibacter qinzhouensis TaxID=2603253 RepID=A0A5C8JI02_9BACT|nr:GNAT family protein [Pontibacter qinzhouensis]TXK38135.1 GNAT family N-acetyltransferase [Pontibacter qinzhouensis]